MFEELGFYLLAGQARSTRDALGEISDGERLGFGTAFVSERYNKKEAASCAARPVRSARGCASRPRPPTTTPAT